MEKVRLGIVGFGGMGQGLIRRAEDVDEVEVLAAVDPEEENREKAREQFGLNAYEDLDGMLAAGQVEAAYVATPNKFHAEQTIRCLRAGLHVFCEKPMAMSAEEGRRMMDAAEEAGRKLTFNLSFRATGPARALRQAVEDGMLGEVYYARTGWMRNRGIPWKGWFNKGELSGGGPLIDLGVHRIDLALWLMDYPTPVAVSGATYDRLGKRIAEELGRQYTVEDLAAGFVRFDNGATLSLQTSWVANSEWKEDMYTYVYGTDAGAAHRHVGGTYEFEALLWGEVAGTFAETRLEPAPAPDHLAGFVHAVLRDEPVPVDPHQILQVQRIIDALYESAETGREVRL